MYYLQSQYKMLIQKTKAVYTVSKIGLVQHALAAGSETQTIALHTLIESLCTQAPLAAAPSNLAPPDLGPCPIPPTPPLTLLVTSTTVPDNME
jgi:hypothetical protein